MRRAARAGEAVEQPAPQRARTGARAILIALAAAAIVLAGWQLLAPPFRSIWLVDQDGARWVRHDEGFRSVGRGGSDEATLFRRAFELEHDVTGAVLTLHAYRAAAVLLDGKVLKEPGPVDTATRESARIVLPDLEAGRHELTVAVLNRSAHPALLAGAPAIGVRTGEGFESSRDGSTWQPATPLDETARMRPVGDPWTVPAAVSRSWPLFLLAAAAGGALAWMRRRVEPRDVVKVKVALMIAWGVLALNNLFALPLGMGMDVDAHVAYVRDMARTWRPPLPDEGWERLQPPLYYFLSALVWQPLQALGIESMERALRIVPLACGIGLIEIAARLGRRVLPERPDAQVVVIVVTAALPMHVHIAQSVGNEPLAGMLMALVLLLCVDLVCVHFATRAGGSDVSAGVRVRAEPSTRRLAILGLVLGLACLTKVTALALVPVALAAAACSQPVPPQPVPSQSVASRQGRSRQSRSQQGRSQPERSPSASAALARRLRAAGIVALVACTLCGWYYARNWIAVGTPVVGGWSQREIDQEWWQDPSYRIPAHVLRFGESLVRPTYAVNEGLWDGLWSTMWLDGSLSGRTHPPPWNLTLALPLAWIGVPLALCALFGAVRPVDGRTRALRRVLLGGIALVLAAMLLVFLRFPVYSAVKATYGLGLVPAMATLMALGLAPLLERRSGRIAAGALLACLVAFSFGAFFVVR